MTVTAGSAIVCDGTVFGSDPMVLYFNDPVNGMYHNIRTATHQSSTNTQMTPAIFMNSAGGSITPQVTNWEAAFEQHIKCRSITSARTSFAVDGGVVNEIAQVTGTNPTSGSTVTPTNNNEIVLGLMSRANTCTTSDSAPWVPGGTITAIGTTGNYPLYDHYTIQTTATAQNSPMTCANSAAYTNMQYAILNASNPAGYLPITGFYGVPAIAKTNAANATAADLGGATTTLSSLRFGTNWTLTGTVATYDTGVAPSGTGTLMAQAVTSTFGAAATSVKIGTGTNTVYERDDKLEAPGTPMWLSAFLRIGGTGISTGQVCDIMRLYGGSTESSFFIQMKYDTTNLVQFGLEPVPESGISPLLQGFSLDTDYRVQMHIAGASERYHQLIVQSKSGAVWSVAQTLNYDVLCTVLGATGCTTPTSAGSGTGSATSGSTALTITSSTGSIVAGQVVLPSASIAYLTQVESVTGTCSSSCAVVLSQNTIGAVSGTVNFITPPTNLIAATSGTVSSGSTAVTIVVPLSGTIAVGDTIGGPAGLPTGTYVAAISGTSLTLSQPVTSAITAGGLWFWNSPANIGPVVSYFGKWSTCTAADNIWFSAMHGDPLGTWGAYVPN